jgi:hypothetical protein
MSLRIDQIVNQVKTPLEAFARGLNGSVSVARDPYNVFELIAANPRGYRLILHWAGDKNISEVSIMPLLNHRLEVVLNRNLGLPVKPDQALTDTIGSVPPLFQSVDELRTILLGLKFSDTSTGGYLEYGGCDPLVAPDGAPLAAYQLTFFLRATPATQSNQTAI